MISIRHIARVLATVTILLAATIARSFAADLEDRLIAGAAVEIKPYEHEHRLTARTIQVLPTMTEEETSSPVVTIRAPIDEIDPASGAIEILGRRVAVTQRTRVPSTLSSLTQLKRGQWAKVKIDASDPLGWSALRLEVDNIDHRIKIDGPIATAWRDDKGGIDSVSLGGLVVAVSGRTRFDDHTLTPSERLFDWLVTARDPKESAPWLDAGWIWSRGKIGVNQHSEDNFTAGDSSRDYYRDAETSLRTEWTVRGPARLSAFVKLRSRATSVFQEAPLRQDRGEKAIHLYEAYAVWRDILALPVALQVGRQDFDGYREWVFDDQLDAVRLYLYPLYPIVAEVAYINSFDDSPSNKLRSNRDYLLDIHGRVAGATELGVYRLWRTDSDVRGREPIWTGLRWHGSYRFLRPWADLAWMRGWDKGRRLDANAYDIGATLAQPVGSLQFSVSVGTARASGNTQEPKQTGIDREFRQTGYEDNTGAFGGVGSFQYYGEIFDPELANLDILTVGSGVMWSQRASMDVVYHRYRQAESNTEATHDLQGTGLTLFDYGGRGIDPGSNRYYTRLEPYPGIGWEIDVIVSVTRVFGVIDIKWITGYFEPGDALFAPWWSQLPFKPKKHSAFLNQVSLEYQF